MKSVPVLDNALLLSNEVELLNPPGEHLSVDLRGHTVPVAGSLEVQFLVN